MQSSTDHEQLAARETRIPLQKHAGPGYEPWICLAIAAVLLLFANGADNVPLAAWLAPVFLLRFVRCQSLRVGVPIGYALLIAAFAFQFRGMVPIPGLAYYIFLLVMGVPLVLAYVVDRLIAHRLSGLMATLVFPSTWAATELLSSRGIYGSWGSAAYSQSGNLPLLQMISVTGLWGVSFLMGWFATTCNRVWEEGITSQPARRGAWLCLGTIAAVTLLGSFRLAVFPPSSATVRVASISKRQVQPSPSDTVFQRAFDGTATSGDLDTMRRWATMVDNDLLTRAETEMQAGAKIVFWGETNASVLKQDEAALIARGATLAEQHQAFLGMALGVLNSGAHPPLENKLVLIQPDGRVAWEYHKVRPVPGPEAEMQVRGDGKLRVLETPYGRLSSIICFDGDFPHLLAQAGSLHSDIVIDPSNDWRAIDPWHTQMASFRAIEQGFNLVRHTSRGLSAAFDYQGRRLATMDDYQASDQALIAQVPTKGVRTIYSRMGDWFGWVCLCGAVFFIVASMRQVA